MFDLDREVMAWSLAAHADRCGNGASVAELSDHLHCEIDRARAEGLTDEQAFAAAVTRLGPAKLLAAEHAKNRSLVQKGCAVAARFDRLEASREYRGLLLAHSFLWASLMVAISLLTRRAMPGTSAWLLLCILIPMWLGSDLILRRAMQHRPAGGPR